MKEYTIGALFRNDFTEVLLIEKQKPEWQKGKLNFPGGKVEHAEALQLCIAREFNEETGLSIPPDQWLGIGEINGHGYDCYFYTAVYDEKKHGSAATMETERVNWYKVNDLPANTISNLYWLIPFAINWHNQGNADHLVFGKFQYAEV